MMYSLKKFECLTALDAVHPQSAVVVFARPVDEINFYTHVYNKFTDV